MSDDWKVDERLKGKKRGDASITGDVFRGEIKTPMKPLFIILLVAGAISIGSVGWYLQTSDAEITPETKAEMYNFIKDTYVTKAQLEEIKDGIQIVRMVINDNKAGANKNFTSIAKTLQNHNNQLIVLRAASQIVLPPTTTGTADYQLRTINTDSQTVTEFAQNEAVLITGIYNGQESQATYEVRKNNAFVQSGSISISGGTFTFAYNVVGNAELGTYTITITIDNKKDSVSFEIE